MSMYPKHAIPLPNQICHWLSGSKLAYCTTTYYCVSMTDLTIGSYGISRVFSQQCNYVLTDLQTFKDKMRGIAQVMKELEIDPEVGRTKSVIPFQCYRTILNHVRPDQLNLPEDPAFVPDFDMNLDLAAFDIFTDASVSRSPSVLSPHSFASSQTSRHAGEEELELLLPSMDTHGEFGGLDINVGGVTSSAVRSGSKLGPLGEFEESAIIENPEFEFDRDGNLVLRSDEHQAQQSEAPSVMGQARAPSESGISARVRAEHEVGMAQHEVSFRQHPPNHTNQRNRINPSTTMTA